MSPPSSLTLDDFDYALPPERIAQQPASERTASRLLVVDRTTGALQHAQFSELARFLPPGSLLVFNNTRVIPARLLARKPSGGLLEVLLLRRPDQMLEPLRDGGWGTWECLIRSNKPIKIGQEIYCGPPENPDHARATVTAKGVRGHHTITLIGEGDLATLLRDCGEVPLPPYIERPEGPNADDRARYQSVLATRDGAIAAPTASLHFSQELIKELRAAQFRVAEVTLHVGLGTFLPVRTLNLDEHVMHAEAYEILEPAATEIAKAKREGRSVVAVGTTVARALESAVTADGRVPPGPGESHLFIRPGYEFKVVDALITNFHLPRSTLLMLVAALSSREIILNAYTEAISHSYRFYSYGDGMLIS